MNDSCRTHAQSHAATVPPSNGATCRSSALQKAQIVYLVSYNTTFRELTHIRWCCIDLLRPPFLSERFCASGAPKGLFPKCSLLSEPKILNLSWRLHAER